MYSMNYIGKFISNFRDFYNEINPATLTGAIDVVVVEQPDGSFTCSPFHVRFGKLGVLRSREKVVDIEINGEPLDIHMKLGESGEAFFVEEVSPDELLDDVPPHLACSPIPTEGGCFPAHFHRGQSTLGIPSSQGDEWSRRRSNSEVIKRRPKETVDQTFAQDDIQEYPGKGDRMFEWRSEVKSQDMMGYGSAPELANTETTFCPPPLVPSAPIPVPVSTSTPAIRTQARTFKAETVDPDGGVETCKIVTDFTPITDACDGGSTPPSSSAPLIPPPDAAAPEAITTTPLDSAAQLAKKKRRRKSMKKKNGGINNNAGSQRRNSEAGEASDTSTSVAWESATSVLSAVTAKPAQNQQGGQGTAAVGQEASTPSGSSTAADTMSADTPTPTSPGVPGGILGLNDELTDDLSKIQNASTEADFHFFSDTEVLPGNSPDDESRPCSAVQSDTEFETANRPGLGDSPRSMDGLNPIAGADGQPSWHWGELPTPPVRHPGGSSTVPTGCTSSDEEEAKHQEEAAAQKSMLSGMFSFMKKTKRIRHNPESEGIYLSELNGKELDPEVAALYFPSYHQRQGCPAPGVPATLQRDEDAESGNGPSLPQSPHSVEGAIGGPKSVDSDFEEPKLGFEKKAYGDISLSLCGGLQTPIGITEENFLNNIVTFNDLEHNPLMLENPNLVVRFDGQYYNWKTACSIIMPIVIFQRQLPEDSVKKVAMEYMPNAQNNCNVPQPKVAEGVSGGRGYSSWFYWRRSSSNSEPKKMVSDPGITSGKTDVEKAPKDTASASTILEMPDDLPRESEDRDCGPVSLDILSVGAEVTVPPEGGVAEDCSVTSLPKESLREEGYNGSNSSDSDDAHKGIDKSLGVKIPIERRSYYHPSEKYRKTLRLSSEQIAQLNLKEGTNEVVFSVTTAYQGTSRCKCNIYRWRYDDKVVISDIDGTITKSDVLGHILPIVGKDWAQSGVAQLFTKIQNNGYRLLYLSARAIGQARVTREYLRSIKQDDLSLPDGPLLLNPTSLMSALHREVIERKPEEFKISCLRDIQALFPSNCKPFYAGYGNKINDVWAYRAVGIPIFRIFTINHRGELKHELTQTFQSSYLNMSSIADQMFPPVREDLSDNFNNFLFWRLPITEIDPKKAPLATASTAVKLIESSSKGKITAK